MATSDPVIRRDTIIVGSSAGGVDAVPRIIGQLPRELAAAVVVVQHMAPHPNPMFADIIQRQSQIRVRWVEQGDPLEPGTVHVAPPGVHVMLHDSRFQLIGGARENHVRPSIDRLMRSAAAQRGPRTVGVLLTGMLDDGVAGLGALQDAGGYTIVQDPADAVYSDLPRRALQALDPDRVLQVDAIGGALIRLVEEPAEPREPPANVVYESKLDGEVIASPDQLGKLGPQTPLSCPDCGGPTWHVGTARWRRYRCYLGHQSSAERILEQSDEQVEGAMWSAIRALHERVTTYDRLAADALDAGSKGTYTLFHNKAEEARTQVELAREFMLRLVRRTSERAAARS
jgi:two-component system chemotaxis response regulator CheB